MLKARASAAAGLCFILASAGIGPAGAAGAGRVGFQSRLERDRRSSPDPRRSGAATDRRDEAEAAIQAAIDGMDVNDEAQARQIEQAYEEIQSANQAVTEAQMGALEREAEARATQ